MTTSSWVLITIIILIVLLVQLSPNRRKVRLVRRKERESKKALAEGHKWWEDPEGRKVLVLSVREFAVRVLMVSTGKEFHRSRVSFEKYYSPTLSPEELQARKL